MWALIKFQLAVARTWAGQDRYAGGSGNISLHNPRAYGLQFTAARIKLQRGPDSIEAGWRVSLCYTLNEILTEMAMLNPFDFLTVSFRVRLIQVYMAIIGRTVL